MPFRSTIEVWLCPEVNLRSTPNDFEAHSSVICYYVEHRVIIVWSMGGILSQSSVDRKLRSSEAYIRNIRSHLR